MADQRGESGDRGGSATGGTMGEEAELGASEPVADYEGEDGPPVQGGERVDER